MFRLPDSWNWDFWIADDGQRYHLFFLFASRALHEEHRRHMRASVGHAVSDDLVHWERIEDALVRGDFPSVDDVATWTGSVVRDPSVGWRTLYTGLRFEDGWYVQRITAATSPDLLTWTKDSRGALAEADPRWYEKAADGTWVDEAFRDPWVVPDPGGDGWHLLITARANTGPSDDRGVIGHAWSPDLLTWQVRPPLTQPGQGFGQLEVPQAVRIEGRWVLLFSCLRGQLSAARQATGTPGGVWYALAESELGPFDIAGARLVTGPGHFAGRVVHDRSGRALFLAFCNEAADGSFLGGLDDPRPIGWDGDELVLGERLA